MRRVFELNWPALLAGAACAGLAASNWIALSHFTLVVLVLVGLTGILFLEAAARVAAVGIVRADGPLVGLVAARCNA